MLCYLVSWKVWDWSLNIFFFLVYLAAKMRVHPFVQRRDARGEAQGVSLLHAPAPQGKAAASARGACPATPGAARPVGESLDASD